MPSVRQEKLASLMQRELAQIFQRESIHLPPGVMITITVVRMSPDLSYARIYLSILGGDDAGAVVEQINTDKGYYRRLLGKSLGKVLRIIPDMQFFLDDSLDYAEQINDLLQ
jgi:ribosome-binding factor A